jgi:hypothetical protein
VISPEADRRVLPSNVDMPLPGFSQSRRSRLWPLLLSTLVAVGGIGAATLFGSQLSKPAAAAAPLVASTDQPDPGGNTIVHDCFVVADHQCLTANPSIHPALEQLATTAEGPMLLEAAVRAGVAVRVGTLDGMYAAFDTQGRAVTLDTSLTKMSARGQAAIVAHELRAVATWSSPAGILPHTGLTCVQEETSAYATELSVWKELRAPGPAKDALETEEDDLVQRMNTHGPGFWLELAMKIRAVCN